MDAPPRPAEGVITEQEMQAARLFREEVMRSLEQTLLGDVESGGVHGHWILITGAVTFGLVIVIFLLTGTYTSRARVEGTLMPNGGLLEVGAVIGGQVTGMTVHIGSHVAAGSVLLSLVSQRHTQNALEARGEISDKLREQRKTLADSYVQRQQLTRQDTQGLRMKLSSLDGEQAYLDQQIVAQKKQTDLAQALVAKLRPVQNDGYISQIDFEREETNALNLLGGLQALKRQRAELDTQRQELHRQLAELPILAANDLNELQRRIDEVEQNLAQNEAQRAVELRAPNEAIVNATLVHDGQNVVEGAPLLTLSKVHDPLQASLLAPSRAAGFVKIGQAVSIQYDAFPHEKFGVQDGVVRRIASAPLSPAEISTAFGIAVTEPMYRIDVGLSRQSITAYRHEEPLRAGMRLTADIRLDRRTLIEWIFAPLLSYTRAPTPSPT